MKRAVGTIYILILLAVVACKRMPLYDVMKDIQLELELDLEIDIDIDVDVQVDVEVEKVIKTPEHMKVGFYSVDDQSLKYTEYVGAHGGAITTPAGVYLLLAYTFGTEFIQIRGEDDIKTIEAFTSDITATKGATLRGFHRAGENDEPQGPIIYAPDHLLVAKQLIEIPDLANEDENIVVHTTAKTICETYSFEVKTVVGAEWIESCEAFVTNQARSSFFGLGEVSKEPATIYFPVGVDRTKGTLYTTFNTFGKLPGESHAFLHLLVRDTDGKEYRFSTDITDQFTNPDHGIVIEEKVDIPEPASHGGGIDPSVDPWTEENTDVTHGDRPPVR